MDNCTICLTPPTDQFMAKCGHGFCNSCILTWVTQHDDCPICRGDITETKTLEEDGEDEDEETPQYDIEVSGNINNNEYDEIMDVVYDFIDMDNEPEYKWKDSTNGSSHTIIKKSKYFVDLKFDLFQLNDRCDYYKLMVDVKKRPIIKYNKKHPKNSKIFKQIKRNHLFR